MPDYRSKILTDTSFLLCVSAAIILMPFRWLAASVFAAACHELGHVILIYLCGQRILSIHFDLRGIVLQTESMPLWKETICTLGGPAAGCLVVLSCGMSFPEAAICALVQTGYNILPIYPLDGGRILQCVTEMVFGPDISWKLCRICKWITLIILAFVLAYGWLMLKIWLIPATALLLAIKMIRIKIPCKVMKQRLQ